MEKRAKDDTKLKLTGVGHFGYGQGCGGMNSASSRFTLDSATPKKGNGGMVADKENHIPGKSHSLGACLQWASASSLTSLRARALQSEPGRGNCLPASRGQSRDLRRCEAARLPSDPPPVLPSCREALLLKLLHQPQCSRPAPASQDGALRIPATGTRPCRAKPWKAHRYGGPGSAQEPESVAPSAKAKHSTSRTGPSTSTSTSTSQAGTSTSTSTSPAGTSTSTSQADPSTRTSTSTSQAGPSTSTSTSTSPAGTSTSTNQAGPSTSTSSTSSSSLGGAMAHEALFGRSQSSRPIPQEARGASTSGPLSSAPEEAPQEALGGWDYQWIPQNRVLRYSQDQLNQDRNKALRLSAARKEQEQATLRGRRSPTSRGRCRHDPGEGSTSGRMPPPAPKRSRSERVRRESGSWGASCRATAEDPQQDATPVRREVQVDPPMSLRPMLILDWDMVTLRKMLCNLPAKVNADAILCEYATFPQKHRTRDQSCTVWGLVAVLKEYFNVLLSPQLLYDFERPQYDELVVSYPSSQMCELYGGIHVLRFFEHLGPMIT
ncbi:uncharacterized protein [Notamacropus eugenii]|uniref:uncharacterized protein n=1 Tax=Notamacropus eugenii TaxID=9315 RepID=UPI003B67D5B7